MAGFLSPKFGRPSITEKTNPRLGAIVAVRTYVSVAGKHEEISVLSEDQLLQLHYRQGIPPAGRMVAETIRSSAPSRSVGSDIPYDCQDAQAAIAVVGRAVTHIDNHIKMIGDVQARQGGMLWQQK
jgi:hypothetical protein